MERLGCDRPIAIIWVYRASALAGNAVLGVLHPEKGMDRVVECGFSEVFA
jgi:hypothetical protein